MITLQDYIVENIAELKTTIKKQIDNINNVELLNKVSDIVAISDEDYAIFIENVDKRFDVIGLNDTTKNSLKQKIKHYGKLREMSTILSDDDMLITSDELLKGDNLYNLILTKLENNNGIKIDDKFKSLLADLADFDVPNGSIGKGKCELLSQLFLKDLNPNNKGAGDINCGDNILEYKLSMARIKGGTTTLETPKVINDKFIELVTKYLDEKSIKYDKEVINEPNIFSSGKSIEAYFEKLFDLSHDIESENINEFIVESLIEQISAASKYKSKFIDFVKSTPVVSDKGLYTSVVNTNTKSGAKEKTEKTGIYNFQNLFLLIHLYTYQFAEGWTNLVLFGREKRDIKSKLTGNYCVLNSENNLENMYKQLQDNNIVCSAFPMYNDGTKIKGSNERNWAPTIVYVK